MSINPTRLGYANASYKDTAVDASSKNFDTLLLQSINQGCLATAQKAIEAGANIRQEYFEHLAAPGCRNSRKILMTPMLKIFIKCANADKIADKLQIACLLNAKALSQLANNILEQFPEFLLPPLVDLVAAYHGTDLFSPPQFKAVINEIANLRSGNRFENAPIIMALKEGPSDLINLRAYQSGNSVNCTGSTLLARARKAGNGELVEYLQKHAAPE